MVKHVYKVPQAISISEATTGAKLASGLWSYLLVGLFGGKYTDERDGERLFELRGVEHYILRVTHKFRE